MGTKKKELVDHPSHYNRNGIEVDDVILAFGSGNWYTDNAIKYLLRHPWKDNPRQDLEKCKQRIQRALDLMDDMEVIEKELGGDADE